MLEWSTGQGDIERPNMAIAITEGRRETSSTAQRYSPGRTKKATLSSQNILPNRCRLSSTRGMGWKY